MNEIKMMARKVLKREAYQVGSKLFRTKAAAAKSEAWRLIMEKYGWDDSHFMPCMLSNVKHAAGNTCNCDPDSYDYCPLHDRKSGYFKRLNTRLASLILEQWNKAEVTE
jgi:hypothetical protein